MTRGFTHEISTVWLPKQDILKDNTRWHTNMDVGNLARPHPLGEELQVINEPLRKGESVFSTDKHPDRLFNTKCSALNTYDFEQH